MTADPRNDYLAAYRRSVESPPGARENNLQAVLERAGQLEAAEPAPARWAASALILKLTTVALVTTGLGWGAVSVLSEDAPQPAVNAVTPAPEVTQPAPPARAASLASPATISKPEPAAPTPQPIAVPETAPRHPTVAPKPESKPEAAADRLREEIALLDSAQRHLAAGHIAQADRVLREHARRFPRGTLSLERSAWSAIAACSGSGPQPKAAARSFILTHADTPLGAKVKAECDL